MSKIPTKTNPFRLDEKEIARALGIFDDRRSYVELQDTVWISPEPRMPAIHVFYNPKRWEGHLLDGAILADDKIGKLLVDWAKDSTLEAHLPPFVPSGDAVKDGIQGMYYAARVESASCTGIVRYDLHERDDLSATTFLIVRLRDSVEIKLVPTSPFTAVLDFGPRIRGGEVLASFKMSALLFQPEVGYIKLLVRGKNPSKQAVRDALEQAAKQYLVLGPDPEIARKQILALHVLAGHESWFTQFFEQGDKRIKAYLGWVHRYRPDLEAKDVPGLPVVGRSNDRTFHGGFGIMQLDNPAPSAEEIWNWRANVEAGVKLYAKCVEAAGKHLMALYKQYGSLGAKWFRDDEVRKEIWVRYNSGAGMSYWGYWDKVHGVWQPGGAGKFKSEYANILGAIFDGIEQFGRYPGYWR